MEETINKHLILLALQILFIFSACGRENPSSRAVSGPGPASTPATQTNLPTSLAPTHRLTVFAAASLTDAFLQIGQRFEAAHPGVKADFSFAGSQILRTQLEQGAMADVVAFADQKDMDILKAEDLISPSGSQDFATNRMVVILPTANPGKLNSLAELAKPNLKLVLADESVPAGNYARQILVKMSEDPIYGADFSAKVMANVVSNETDVRQVVTKVELGEADGGIVYISDTQVAKDLLTITVPDKYNVVAYYPIAVLANAPTPDLAASFVEYITSPAGQEVLREWGFTPVNKP